MTLLDKQDLIRILGCVSDLMIANRDLLCNMDAELGDGDLGLTMSKAFPAAEKEAIESEESDIGKIMVRCGMKMNSAAPSTMGTLMASSFIYTGKALAEKTTLDAKDFARFYMLFADGAASRGKAKRGERTVLDVLYPAADAAEQEFTNGTDIVGIASAALGGAEAGLESTKDMLPKYGKSAPFTVSAIGKTDQGAFVGKLFIEGIYVALARKMVA